MEKLERTALHIQYRRTYTQNFRLSFVGERCGEYNVDFFSFAHLYCSRSSPHFSTYNSQQYHNHKCVSHFSVQCDILPLCSSHLRVRDLDLSQAHIVLD